MASNVVNLNKFRKAKTKVEKEKRADTNRRLHGRTKAEREREAADKARLEKQVDGAFLERGPTVPRDEPALPGPQAPLQPLPLRPRKPAGSDESE